jgi:mRNA-degrading endonuclease RelE of RelBE toxin-antitoxin system
MRGEVRGAWRIPVGHYRVIYDVDDDQRLVVILAVLPRHLLFVGHSPLGNIII